jgi:N-glycosylase/DNA lyase
MNYSISNNDIHLVQPDFSLDETLDCGQAFRWVKISDNTYQGFSADKPLIISEDNGEFIFHDTSEDVFLNYWCEYFDLNTDYSELKSKFSEDKTLKKACEFAPGIRLLKQDKWEALCSFIISQNNNIPRIKGIVERLCENFGEKKAFGYTFPTAERIASLSVEDLQPLRAGFRARYILDAAKRVASGEIDLDKISKLPLDEARAELMKICGVGIKVADCALLYGMYRLEFFPVDVWIKRVLEQYYPDGLPECIKGYEGIAQQYLFHYIRNL